MSRSTTMNQVKSYQAAVKAAGDYGRGVELAQAGNTRMAASLMTSALRTWAPQAELDVVEVPQGDLWVLDGIFTRLKAGVSSILDRGIRQHELAVGVRAKGRASFVWDSDSGCWSQRHWRVTGVMSVVDGHLAVDDVVVAVASTSTDEWTAFVGGSLNAIMTDRLRQVVAKFAAYWIQRGEVTADGWSDSPFNEEELARSCSEYVTHPEAAWETPHGRIVLQDDDYGVGRLTGTLTGGPDEWDPEPPAQAVRQLIELWWQNVSVTEQLDDGLPDW